MSYEMKKKPVTTGVPIDPANPKGPKKEMKLKDAEAPVFSEDTAGLNDAISYFGGGDAGAKKIIELVNTQHMTNVMNAIRSAFNKGPSEQVLADKAHERFLAMLGDPTFVDKVKSYGGDIARLKADIMEPIIADLRASYQQERLGMLNPDQTGAEAGSGEETETTTA